MGDAMTESSGAARSSKQEMDARDDLSSDARPPEVALEPASRPDEEMSEPVQLLVSAVVECARDENAKGAEMAFSALAKYADRLRPEVVELIVTAKAKSGDVADAARGLVYAAERWRLIGEWGRAVDLCQLAYNTDSDAPGVHRTWGLALLAMGDAEGARGHLERWREEQEHEVDSQREGSSPGQGKPRVLLAGDVSLRGASLSRALEEADFDVASCGCGSGIVEAANQFALGPDLIVVPIRPSDPLVLDRIREIRASKQLLDTPILGVVDSHGSAEDRRRLRALGVVGLVDRGTSPAHLICRLNRIVRPTHGRCLHERVPAFFSVELEANGRILKEYALSLSIGGMGVTSAVRLDPNTEVRLRFRLEDGGDPLEASGRVVYCHSGTERSPINEIGILFADLDVETRSRLEREVRNLLDH